MVDPRAFIRKLLDIEMPDGSDVQDLAVKHGLLERRPLTAEQIADEDGPWHEYGCEEGDPWQFPTAAYLAWLEEGESDG